MVSSGVSNRAVKWVMIEPNTANGRQGVCYAHPVGPESVTGSPGLFGVTVSECVIQDSAKYQSAPKQQAKSPKTERWWEFWK